MPFSLRKEVERSYRRYLRPQVQRWAIRRSIEVLRLFAAYRLTKTDLAVCCLVRDAEHQVDSFIDHYIRLGARRIVILDNGSVDGTVDRALKWDGVSVLRSRLAYPVFKYGFKQYFLDRFGQQCWCLISDVDERFDYPCSSSLPLRGFLEYLNQNNYTGVMTHMLDMFPAGPISTWPGGGERLEMESRFYDLSGLQIHSPMRGRGNQFANTRIARFSGGIRRTKFQMPNGPSLTKIPLLFRSKGAIQSPLSAHESRFARVADISCVFAHYKFHRDFVKQCQTAVERKNYHDGSEEYAKYLEVLGREPQLCLQSESSREYRGVDQLVRDGFLIATPQYEQFVSRYPHRFCPIAA